jgi:aminopeptidase YwaD
MTLRIPFLVPTLILFFLSAESQKISKSDKVILANLQTHGQSLAADTAGAATSYLISSLSNASTRPKGDNNGWVQSYSIDYGRQPQEDALFSVDNKALVLYKEWFPLTICPPAQLTGSPAIALQESGVPWFQDLKEMLEAGSANPHFDLVAAIRTKAAACKKKGATALILYNSSSRYPDKLAFDPMDKAQPADIPVLYITREAKRKYLKDESASVDLSIRIGFRSHRVGGENVIGSLDYGAATTIVIAAKRANNSGISVLLELARLTAAAKLQSNNYLFIVYRENMESWLGSGIYAAHPVIDLKKVNYLLVLDQLGSMNDTTHLLNIGGYASSAAWATIGNSIRDRKYLTFRYDSTSNQPLFSKQQIPFLVFSTGPDHPLTPVNYPGELRALKYIYSMIEAANTRGKIGFTP